ncbi:MAG TPA: EAL domain-containing protein [Xanthomonadales bacterium]|nr:EAL domain-containing protein [Xanthomonadales bacterium]
MNSILVVERSTTLSHLLGRTLAAANLHERVELSSYAEALSHLAQCEREGRRHRIMLLGAPPRPTREFAELINHLRLPRDVPMPVVVLAHEKTPDIASWTDARPEAQFVPWSQFAKIPVAIRQLSPEPDVAAEGTTSKPPNGLRVLFVDDSASIRVAYQRMLERDGFATDTAETIAEGFERARGGSYDLAIIDYFLPDGEGDELCRRLQREPAAMQTMLAIITGTYREDAIKRCLEAGAVECMFKNEAKELFLARVNSLARQILMQKKVTAEKQRLDGILGSVGDGVYGVDADGVVSFVNPTAMRLLGVEDESALVGRGALAAFHHTGEDGRALSADDSALARAYAEGEPLLAHETMFWRADGEPLPVECTVLPLAIRGRREGSVVVFRDIADRKSADRMRWELSHDALTGLYNARHFNQAVASEVTRRRESGGYAALLYVDIDRWTHIADASGNTVADQLVIDVGQAYAKRLRAGDVLARVEGDRLALLLTSVEIDNLFTVADGFRELVHACHYVAHGTRRAATASIGVAVLSKETPSAEYAMERARAACKLAKQRGRDQTQIYVGEHELRVARELEAVWSERLRGALDGDRFVFEVQPIVPIAALPEHESQIVARHGWRLNGTGIPHGYLFELLVRMLGNERELISPGVFVPLAERIGLMPKIDLHIVTRALRWLAANRALAGRVSLNVNLSNQTLADLETLNLIADAVRSHNAEPGQLVFEITETSEMGNLQGVRRFIKTMQGLGCRFALDDFGTGFSSLSHLRHLPVDFVKIEGSFVEGMNASEVDHTMVSSITNLAQSLRMKVIAEHVDSFETLTALRRCGVDYVQGNYLGEPRPLAELDLTQVLPMPA